MGNFKVCIVGGGLAGSLLANGLINNVIDTIVFERDEESLKREGYHIRLGDPALTGLASCRPISTYETRNTKPEKGYSSAIEMAAIIQAVMREVYGPSKVSRHFITTMTQEHRSWATRMTSCPKTDGIESAEQTQVYDAAPTLAPSNVKESYYWSIMLLTRPVLLD
ncbi:fungal specific transcription factor factor [Fusarium coicis]|nr:fungal specific transcription factor factor [Fusarium coicis]